MLQNFLKVHLIVHTHNYITGAVLVVKRMTYCSSESLNQGSGYLCTLQKIFCNLINTFMI